MARSEREAQFRCPALNHGEIGHDEGDHEFAPVAEDGGVEDERARLERILDGLRRDVFSARGFQQILFPVGDVQVAVRVEVADVAGAKPTVFRKNFPCGVRVAIVALHHARAFHQDFSVGRDFHFDVRDRPAGASDPVHGVVARHNRRGFRESIALIDGDADGPEEFRQVL